MVSQPLSIFVTKYYYRKEDNMNYWSRNDTKEWISQLENRLDDIDYYLTNTFTWCADNEIEDKRIVFMCAFLTCVWVSEMRDESISFVELMEMLQIKEWECDEDKLYELNKEWIGLDHDELLVKVVERCSSDTNWFDED